LPRIVRHPFLLLALVAAVSLAACGGGDNNGSKSSSTTQTQSTTSGTTGATGSPGATSSGATGPAKAVSPAKARVIAQADAACRRANAKVQRINQAITALNSSGGPNKARDAARVYAKAEKVGEQVVSDLRSLNPPASDRATYRKYLVVARKQVSLLSKAQKALARKNVKRFSALTAEIGAAKNRARTLAQSFGFKVCGVS
jgi:hypothetical protein